MGEIGTTRNVTALRALDMAMSLVAVISLGSFAYGVHGLRDSPAVLEQASGRMDVRHDSLIGQQDGAKAQQAAARGRIVPL